MPCITEANSDNWNKEGQNDDLRIEDLLPLCVFGDAAGFVLEEMFEARAFCVLFFPIAMTVDCSVGISLERIT